MNLYELLGVAKDASVAQIRAAYRKLSKIHHPDRGGDAEKFGEIKLALDVLVDPKRRKTYDETGRTSEQKISPMKLKKFLQMLFKSVVNSENPRTGLSDDPVRENIRDKIVASLERSIAQATQKQLSLRNKIARADELIARFIPPEGGTGDPVADALKAERAEVQRELHEIDDEIEIGRMAQTLVKGYTYKADPGAEGPFAPGPTVYHSRGNGTYHIGRGIAPQG
jgi:curved DNA-binding protein CbpA